jgi:hypothetical protein
MPDLLPAFRTSGRSSPRSATEPRVEGREADDVIATLATRRRGGSGRRLTDRDAFQLVWRTSV